jgi:DNA-binding transcriptional regulator YiaG
LPGPFGWNDKALNAEKEDMAKRNDEDLAKMIKDLRAKLGLTQEQFAAKVGVTFSTVNRWENGRGKSSPLAMRRIEELREGLDEKK